jgi:hypothetical protein
VIGGALRLIAVVTAIVLLATGASACGGDEETTTTSSTRGGTKQEGPAKETASGGSSKNDSKQPGGGESAAPPNDGGSDSAPLRVSGGGSGQYRTRGGDNSIQNFGEEADESELEAAAEAVHGFYVARAEEEWSRACSYLAQSMLAQLEQLAEQSPQLSGKECPAILQALTRPLPASARRETTVVDAGSLRREGERGFLIYYGAGKTVYAITLEDEGGTWKVGSLAPLPIA